MKSMRVFLFAALFTAILLTTWLVQAAKPPSAAETEELRTVVYKMWTGWDSLDPAKVAEFYSKDPNDVFFDISPLKFQGWSAYADGAAKALVNMASAKWEPTGDFKVIKEGNLAVTTLTMNVVFTSKNGASNRAAVRDTGVWEKQGGKWIMRHQHTSMVSGAGLPPAAVQKSKE
jgi:ketosteroid isomerase-like protein